MKTKPPRGNSPDDVLTDIGFSDIFSIDEIQRLQDLFSDATGVASLITLPDGTPITKPSNFCRLCNSIIRKTEKGLANCMKSDAVLGQHHASGPIVLPCLSGELWDAGASITVGGKHMANWLIGQVRNDESDEQRMIEYADEIGANREDFMKALAEVPVMPAKQFRKVSDMLFAFAHELSDKAYKNLQLNTQVEQRENAIALLKKTEMDFADIFQTISVGIAYTTLTGEVLSINQSLERLLGIPKEDLIGKNILALAKELLSVSSSRIVIPTLRNIIRGKAIKTLQFEYKDKVLEINISINKGSRRLTGVVRDVTEYKQVESGLNESEEKFRLIAERTSDTIVLLDMDLNLTYVSPSVEKITGYSAGEALHMKIDQILTPESFHRALEMFEAVIPSEISGSNQTINHPTIELEENHKNGSTVWVELSFSFLKDHENKPIGIVTVSRDITERKRSEMIMESRLRLSSLALSHPMDELLQQALAEIEQATASETGFFQYPIEPADALIGSSQARKPLIDNDYPPLAPRNGVRGEDTPITRLLEVPVIIDDKIHAIIGVGNKPSDYTEADAETVSIIVNHVCDLMEKMITLEKVRQTETHYKALIENAADGVVLVDIQGNFKFVSPSSYTMFGYSIEDIHHLHPNELTHPDDLPLVLNAMSELMVNQKKITRMQYRFLHKNGSWIWIDSTFRNLLAEPSVEAIVINFRDISERKVAEDQINKLNQELESRVKQRTAELEAAISELETFSYSVSHDLKAPLRHISGFIGILLENQSTMMDEEEIGFLKKISGSATEMDKLIEAILKFSRLSQAELRKTTINSSSVVQQVIKFFEPELQNRTIRFNVEPLPDVSGDNELIRLVWTNLISNAIKYTGKKDETEIEIGSVSTDEETTFFVKDNGVGFQMKYAEKLFGVFQRLHKSRDFEGVGIGLANVKRIIDRHGGSCRAESEPDQGASFYFSLPK